MRCPKCRSQELEHGEVTELLPVGEFTFSANLPALICSSCGADFVEASVRGEFEVRVANRLVELGVSTPQAFRFMRKSLGLKSSELADLLGKTPETVSSWENQDKPRDMANSFKKRL